MTMIRFAFAFWLTIGRLDAARLIRGVSPSSSATSTLTTTSTTHHHHRRRRVVSKPEDARFLTTTKDSSSTNETVAGDPSATESTDPSSTGPPPGGPGSPGKGPSSNGGTSDESTPPIGSSSGGNVTTPSNNTPPGSSSEDESTPAPSTTTSLCATATVQGDNTVGAERGQVQYVVEVVASSRDDALVMGKDLNDMVVSNLGSKFGTSNCGQRMLLETTPIMRRKLVGNHFLSFTASGSSINPNTPCTALSTDSNTSTGTDCFQVMSKVGYSVVPGNSTKNESPDTQVIQSIPKAFQSLSTNNIQFINATSSNEDNENSSVAAASTGQSSTGKATSPKTVAFVFVALLVAFVAAILLVRRNHRRRQAMESEMDKIERTIDLSDTLDTSNDLAFVYGDEIDTDSTYQITPQEKLFSRLRVSKRGKGSSRRSNNNNNAVVLTAIPEAVVEPITGENTIEIKCHEVVVPNHRDSGTLITPQQKSRRQIFPNTVNL